MIYRRRLNRSTAVRSAHYRIQNLQSRTMHGFGDGDFIRLRDEFGNEWRGVAERQCDETIRYRFRTSDGRYVTGISDDYGILLRDEQGNTWRGFFD